MTRYLEVEILNRPGRGSRYQEALSSVNATGVESRWASDSMARFPGSIHTDAPIENVSALIEFCRGLAGETG